MTDAQKRATMKWRKQNQKNIACALSLEHYEQFQRYAEQHGKTVTGMVKALILDCLAEMEQMEQSEEPTEQNSAPD